MDTVKTVVIMNTIRLVVFLTFVTLVAIHFENIRLLWWYILTPFLGCEVKTNLEGKEEG